MPRPSISPRFDNPNSVWREAQIANFINQVTYSVLAQHQYIIIKTLVLATCFGILSTTFSRLFTVCRYIQCAHTLWDPIVFT